MQNKGLGTWIHRRRVKSAEHTAVIHQGRTYTYAALADRIDRLSHVLADYGIHPGDRVAFLGANHPAYLETLFACGQLGAIFVPLNIRLAPEELSYALNDSGATLLVCADDFVQTARLSTAETGIRAILEFARQPGVDSPYETALAGVSAEHVDRAVELEDPAVILYTSGTTGKPKGAVLTHGNMTWNSYNVIVDYDVTSDAVGLMIAPLFHVAALGMGALPLLLKGGTLVLQEKFEPASVLQAVEKYSVTSLSGVPTTFQLLAEHPLWDSTDLSSLRMLTCGGSAVPLRVLEAYEHRGLRFTGGYGMTETAPGATLLAAAQSREKMVSAGLPHFFSDIKIVDPLGEELPAGEVGEILISGPNVIREYWRRPEASAQAYLDGQWFRSGDMGYVDDQGFLYISDRLKDMIISGGENIYPAEVEQLIMQLEQVESVAVIGVSDDKWGEVPRAVITLKPGGELTEEELHDHLSGRIAKYKIPRSMVLVEQMPRTASGKIRKPALRAEFG